MNYEQKCSHNSSKHEFPIYLLMFMGHPCNRPDHCDLLEGLSRYEKGYVFESTIWYKLDFFGVFYMSNPKSFAKWKQRTNSDFDLMVEVDGELKRVECKLTLKPIFASWFRRDWLSRDSDFIVTNDKSHVPVECRRLLMFKGVELLDTQEFLMRVLDDDELIEYLFLEGIDSIEVIDERDNKSLDLNSVCLLVSELVTGLFGELEFSQLPLPTAKTKQVTNKHTALTANN